MRLQLIATRCNAHVSLLHFLASYAPPLGAIGSEHQHFPSLAKPVRREMTLNRARALSSVLADIPLAFAFSSKRTATAPLASSRRRKAKARSICFGCFRFWPIDFMLWGSA